ncbi:MAG: hypothetical protein LC785_04790 [Acidobacteria bacterium]|nr:hypothetical protein [Acidobacteriota bacterium]
MKEIGSSLAQLFAIILLTVTFAVSVAALSIWADSGSTAGDSQGQTLSRRAGLQ